MEDTTPKKKAAKLAEADKQDSRPDQKQKLSEENVGSPNTNTNGDENLSKSSKSKNSLKRTQARYDDGEEVVTKRPKIETSLQMNDFSKPEVENSGESQKERRRPYHQRMKHTLNCVLQQMEFYFGDSSLSKDRFLKSMVDNSPDGYVDLGIFANFNKLQTLHKDGISRNVLIQALSQSTMLQLNEDKTKVRRITPFQEICQEETDKRTIYVEHLPSYATHMWVRQVFSQCGKVEYVSLPTYKTTKQIKGFAFVEFTKPEEAERACAMLNNPLPDKEMERPGKFPKTNKTLDRLEKLAPPVPIPDSSKANDEVKETQEDPKLATEKEAKKKKKKKTKKKKPEDSVAPASNSSAEQKPDGKKKKKKKKQKPNQAQEQGVDEVGSATSQGDRDEDTSTVEEANGKQNTKVSNKATTEDDKVGEEEAVDTDSSSQQRKKKKKKKKNKKDGTIPSGGADKSTGNSCDTSGPSSPQKESVDTSGPSVPQKSSERTSGPSAPQKESADTSGPSVPKNESERTSGSSAPQKESAGSTTMNQQQKKLSHKERKLLRQEDIRRKKQLKHQSVGSEENENLSKGQKTDPDPQLSESVDKELDGTQPTSILKLKKAAEKKRVEFNPVPITNEFVEAKGARKRKKQKREKPHLRVIRKQEWLNLKNEYIEQQKSHMKALKESLRELKQQENKGGGRSRHQPVDLEDVFGTKPLKLSHDVKMAHVEQMKFTPNVIVQWWCSHEMHRDKIRTMFKESHSSSIAYIDANEEAKSGYIRFKDETSAEEFAKMSRTSASFMARVLPVDQQEEYWEKANADRMKKLGRKKKEQGCDRIARKMFQRNKATFVNKPSRIVFDDGEENEENEKKSDEEETKAATSPDKLCEET